MLSKKPNDRKYKIKVIDYGNGAASISLVDGGNLYNINNRKEPKGKIFGPFKDKYYNRGTLLRKLGIWENGQNFQQKRN
jgi:hypothetical protein